jgi:type I restriction enzyme R subunit
VNDRQDLEEQLGETATLIGARVHVIETRNDLRRQLSSDSSDVSMVMVHKFQERKETLTNTVAEALGTYLAIPAAQTFGVVNSSDRIILMVDEAHRTQEGRLGLDMRAALPNAKFIGLTGTPISTDDRNTWAMFGDPDDPEGALNHYSVERSIHDGATLPVHVETRLVNFHFSAEALQKAFDDLAEEENLTDEEKGKLAAKASHISAMFCQGLPAK